MSARNYSDRRVNSPPEKAITEKNSFHLSKHYFQGNFGPFAVKMTYDLPCMSYMAMYIISVHILNSNSKSSVGADHWKLNVEEGKVLQAEKMTGNSGSQDDHLFSILTNTRIENGEWRIESHVESVNCQHKEQENTEER